MSTILALQHLDPIARGSSRLVYEHPQRPDLLVKVMRPKHLEARYGEGAAWFRRRRRYDPYVLFLREIREYVAAYASHGQSLPIAQKVRGLVETDLGLGLLVEAVRGADGALAPTVAKLISTGAYDESAAAALERFLAELLESDIVVADLHERNMVYACDRDGATRFVMIDGLGSTTLIPFKSLSRTLNRRSKLKRIKRLRANITRRIALLRDSGTPS
jgi:hypothetical protein